MNAPPLVMHLLYRLDFGGLETLLVECINRMPAGRYRHVIVCLTQATAFAARIARKDVRIYELNKAPGLGLGTHAKLWKLFRTLRPDILHTYNLAAIEYAFTAALAGVPVRIHAEHGRDARDPAGLNRKHNFLRRLLVPFIDYYVPVSHDLQRWLRTVVRIPDAKNVLVANGVDIGEFTARESEQAHADPRRPAFVIGTVGRVQDVKNHRALVEAFILLRQSMPACRDRLRLCIVGDGPLLPAIRRQVEEAGIEEAVWLPGARSDIAQIMKTFSVFVLPSIAEGTPVTLLEAMASGLPVVATRVGGIPEVVIDRVTGILASSTQPEAIAAAISCYLDHPALIRRHGAAGRARVEEKFSITTTMATYMSLYDHLYGSKICRQGGY